MTDYRMPYDPTWTADELEEFDHVYVIYDQREGFTPAYVVVGADNVTDAVEVAEEISDGRLSSDSESLVVREVQ